MKVRDSGMPEENYWASFFNADCVLDRLGCNDLRGDVVEFGCGYGLFTIPAAQRTSGVVYALDLEPEMLDSTRSKAGAAGLSNIQMEQRDFVSAGCGRPDESAEYVMLFNILHLEHPVGLLAEAFRVLRDGGKAGIIHWNHDATTPRGPSLDIRPRPEQCLAWAEQAGFELDHWAALDCCPFHYGIVVRR